MVGLITALTTDGETPSEDVWLVILVLEALLISFAVGFFYLARRIERKQRVAAILASSSVEFYCPQCNSARVVQGAEEQELLTRTSHVARCLDCGLRMTVAKQDWRRLPLPEGGDPHETWPDKQHLMRHAPMTTGQSVFVFVGLIGLMVSMFLFIDDDTDGASWKHEGLFTFLSLPILFGLWRLGRWLFPPEPVGDQRCAKCGYDTRASRAAACLHCGTPLSRVPD